MPRLAVLRPACLALFAAACASAPDVPEYVPLSVETADYIRLGEGPCFGACPVYELTLYHGGQYVLMAGRFTEGDERSVNRPADDSFEAAQAILTEYGFADLPEDISPGNEEACPHPATDLPTADITIGNADGYYRTVHYYQGCFDETASAMLAGLREVMRIADLVSAVPLSER